MLAYVCAHILLFSIYLSDTSLARHINPCLVVQPRTTRPDITEKNVLLDVKNQINQ